MNIVYKTLYIVLFAVMSSSLMGQSLRSIDGVNNNTSNPEWGAEGDELYHLTYPTFGDGISSMTGAERPNPRRVSNELFAQSELLPDEQNLSDFLWAFGQFIDHDVILVDNDLREPLAISIPQGDPVFSPQGAPIGMFRSLGMLGTGTDEDNVRAYANDVTAFIDGSGIYGSDRRRATWLRSFEDGKLKVSQGNLLPWNTITGDFNDAQDVTSPFMDDPVRVSAKHFVAGDVRANENPLLTTLHTLFVREHNRLCDEILSEDSKLSDEEVYQKARRLVGGILQSIVYNEWLPAMGLKLPAYNGYRKEVNPQISNVFSSAAFRMGHTLINGNVLRLSKDGEEIPGGHITLRDAFFNPLEISLAGGIEPYLRGMAVQVQQKLDCKVIDDVRNFLFGLPSQGGLDLAAININRGRERGLGDYNSIRSDLGLPRLGSISEVSSEVDAVATLEGLYGSIDDIDPWVGMLAEDYMPGAMFGNTIMAIMEDQFQRLRDGDRFFFEGDAKLTSREKSIIRLTTLRDLIMRNTDIKIMQSNVFVAQDRDIVDIGPDLEAQDLNAIVFPNPTEGIFNVKVYAAEDYVVDISIYDNLGRLIKKKEQQLIEGDNIIPFDLTSEVSSQFYNVVLRRDIDYTVLRVMRP